MTSWNKLKLGIIGGGQLGKMLIQETSKLGIHTSVLNPSSNCPSKPYCHDFFQGDYANFDDVLRMGQSVDALTIEIEHVNIDALLELQKQGKIIFPNPKAIGIIQNKVFQKQFYRENNFPTSDFQTFQTKDELIKRIENGHIKLPFVWKSGTLGYDGKGVSIIENKTDTEKLPNVSGVAEEKIKIQREISVIVCRKNSGEVSNFPPMSMTFFKEVHLIKTVFRDSSLEKDFFLPAEKIAQDVAKSLETVGVLAVEMFVDDNNQILINEIAPRPHNSGHLTIEASPISQYAAHIRSFLGGAVNDLVVKNFSGMFNLVGAPNHNGDAVYLGIEKTLNKKNLFVHLYEKPETKPYRKMGHITVLADSAPELHETLAFLEENIQVVSQ